MQANCKIVLWNRFMTEVATYADGSTATRFET